MATNYKDSLIENAPIKKVFLPTVCKVFGQHRFVPQNKKYCFGCNQPSIAQRRKMSNNAKGKK
jgi:hypothetical protein